MACSESVPEFGNMATKKFFFLSAENFLTMRLQYTTSSLSLKKLKNVHNFKFSQIFSTVAMMSYASEMLPMIQQLERSI